MKKTALFDKHKSLGAKIVDFAGFLMPVSYTSVNDEHIHVRNKVGMFDVSHMGEIEISGIDSTKYVNYICSNDILKLKVGKAQYNCILNNNGGIIDDLIVYKLEERKYLLVVNASNLSKDLEWIISNAKGFNCTINDLSNEISLLAIQGPDSETLCKEYTDLDISSLSNYSFFQGKFGGIDNIIISKTGYTGAGGFELYIKNEDVEKIWELLINSKNADLLPIGLAARDTLRIEMGYCLYGNDINEKTNPIQANLNWITKIETKFIGHEAIIDTLNNGTEDKLIGFKFLEKGIPRKGYQLYNIDKKLIGYVTSGTFSPILKIGIGLGYIKDEYLDDKMIFVKIRDNFIKAEITKTPFI